MTNTHRGVFLLVKLLVEAWNFTKSNTPSWMFFTFKLNKWYQIAQSITFLSYGLIGYRSSLSEIFYKKRILKKFVTSTGVKLWYTMCGKCPCSKYSWSVFSRICTEYGEIRSISLHSDWIRTRKPPKLTLFPRWGSYFFSKNESCWQNFCNTTVNSYFCWLLWTRTFLIRITRDTTNV